MRREAWSAMLVFFSLVSDFAMAINGAPTDSSLEVSLLPAPLSWPWRRTALLLAVAAQLITISALVGTDSIAANWSSLLLAVIPAPLAAAAVFAPAPVNLLAALAGIAVLIVGIAGQLTHTGLFFVPALVVLAVGAVKLWQEQALGAGEGCEQMTRYLIRDWAAIVAALIAPLAAATILLPFRASWPNTNLALLLVVVVVAVAATGNRVAGMIAAIGTAVWFNFFFTLPYERFTIRSLADVTTFVLLLVVGAAVSRLAAYARRLKVVAITDAGYLAQTASYPPAVVDHVRQLIGLLGLQECWFGAGACLVTRRGWSPMARCWPVMVAGMWRRRAWLLRI